MRLSKTAVSTTATAIYLFHYQVLNRKTFLFSELDLSTCLKLLEGFFLKGNEVKWLDKCFPESLCLIIRTMMISRCHHNRIMR